MEGDFSGRALLMSNIPTSDRSRCRTPFHVPQAGEAKTGPRKVSWFLFITCFLLLGPFPACFLLLGPFPATGQASMFAVAYSLDEGTGSLVGDSSGTSNDGMNFNAAWTVGRFGSGLYFNGGDTCTVTNSVNNFPSTEITVAFWMRTSDVENAGTVFSYATQSSNDEFRISDYRNFRVYVKENGMSLQTSVSANDGDWHHIAVTWRSLDGQVLL